MSERIPHDEPSKVTTTETVRLHVDITLTQPFDADDLRALAKNVQDVIVEECLDAVSIDTVKVTQIIPAEGDRFHWGAAVTIVLILTLAASVFTGWLIGRRWL